LSLGHKIPNHQQDDWQPLFEFTSFNADITPPNLSIYLIFKFLTYILLRISGARNWCPGDKNGDDISRHMQNVAKE